MGRLKVYYDGPRECITSEVYAIDHQRDRFLIIDRHGYFKWVPTSECKLDGHKEKE